METNRLARVLGCAIGCGAVLAAASPALAANTKTKWISVRSNGAEANDGSFMSSTSANGRLVAFDSDASNLVGGDANDARDVFVRDLRAGKIRRVSVRSNGAEGNAASRDPSISASGRFVAFRSAASNLVGGDANGATDVFVHDRKTKRTRRVSVRANGAEGNAESVIPSISGNGRFVAFHSSASNLVDGDTNGARDVFVHDRRTGKTRRVSVRSNGTEGNDDSRGPSISADGRFVAFHSAASNLIGGDANGVSDVFVRNRRTGKTRRVSVHSNGTEGDGGSFEPAISADGRLVAFDSTASNLIGGDANGARDIFVHNRRAGKTRRVSVRSNGAEADSGSFAASISADGRFIAFGSFASNLVGGDANGSDDVFRRGPLR